MVHTRLAALLELCTLYVASFDDAPHFLPLMLLIMLSLFCALLVIMSVCLFSLSAGSRVTPRNFGFESLVMLACLYVRLSLLPKFGQ